MKRFTVKRYIDSVDPEIISKADRQYAAEAQELIEMYGMEDMKMLSEKIYQDDDSTDIFRIKKDENGFYVVTYTCVQNEEIEEEAELFELFKYKMIKLDNNMYITAHDPAMHISEYEESILVVKENS